MKNLLFLFLLFSNAAMGQELGHAPIVIGNWITVLQPPVITLKQYLDSPYSAYVIDTPAVRNIDTTYSCSRFEVKVNDPLVANSKRSETGASASNAIQKKTQMYRSDVNFPTWQGFDPKHEVILQINDSTSALGVKAEIVHVDSLYYLWMRCYPNGVTEQFKSYFIGRDTAHGQNNSWVLYFKPSSGSDGACAIYRNGLPVFLTQGTLNNSTSLPNTFTVTGNNVSAITIVVNGVNTLWYILPMYFKTGMYKYTYLSANPGTYPYRVAYVRKIVFGGINSTIADMYDRPTAVVGSNISIQYPTINTTLTGSGSYASELNITNYLWTKVSGGSATIATPTIANTALNSLAVGTYIFQLRVTNTAGGMDSTLITVTVNPAPNIPPIANAGSNINITLPTSSTTLDGTGSTDSDGTIVSYVWRWKSGAGTHNLSTPNSVTTFLNGLSVGVQTFVLTVTDNNGASDSSFVTVTVNAAPPVNLPPIANAGNNVFIVSPASVSALDGTGSLDPDGTIVSYLWANRSVGSPLILHPNSDTSTVINLSVGQHTFVLIVTDNNGSVDSATVTITVIPNTPPVANAGSNSTIILPVANAILNASASTDDGTIVSYLWTQVLGSGAFIASPNSAISTVSNLQEGQNVFSVEVTDNGGLKSSATVTITVLPAIEPLRIYVPFLLPN